MARDELLSIIIPVAGLLLTFTFVVCSTFGGRLVSVRPKNAPPLQIPYLGSEGIDAEPRLRLFLARFLVTEGWLDRPGVIGKWFGPAAWFILAFGSMLGVNLTLLIFEGDTALVPSMTAKTLCIGLIPVVLIYVRHLLTEWVTCLPNFVEAESEAVSSQFSLEVERLFLDRRNLLIGSMIGIAILGFEDSDNAFVQHSWFALSVVVLASFAMTGLAGFALVVMIRGAVIVSGIGALRVIVTSSPYGVLATGQTLLKGIAAATVIYVVAISTALLRSGAGMSLPILVWALAVACLYVAIFIAPQWGLHKQMIIFKRDRLIKIEREYRRLVDEFDRGPSASHSMHSLIEAVRKRREEIERLPEWPFDWRSLAKVLGLAASSTLPILMKAALSVAKFVLLPLIPLLLGS